MRIAPNPGPQQCFLASSADIAIFGGSAGGGKTWALLMEPLRHIKNPGFGAVIFRRTSPQITNEGGLWDESAKLYPHLSGRPKETTHEWGFPAGSRVRFAHLQHEKDRLSWQGAQVPFIGWDELTHFSAEQFWYLTLSRSRTLCGVTPYVRATTNPDPFSWVKEFIAPWIHPEYPDPAESGEVRWFLREAGELVWVPAGTPDAKSATFVRSSVYDNPKLLAANPEYLANLKALPLVERRRLLDGDWEIVSEGNVFRREWLPDVESPPEAVSSVRFWDLAASLPKPGRDPDWTVGLLMSRDADRGFTIRDVQRLRGSPGDVEALVRNTTAADRQRYGARIRFRMEEEPGSAGKLVTHHFLHAIFAGADFRAIRATGDVEERARPLSAASQGGVVRLQRALWNNALRNEFVAFPNASVHDDQVSAGAGAHSALAQSSVLPAVASRARGRQ